METIQAGLPYYPAPELEPTRAPALESIQLQIPGFALPESRAPAVGDRMYFTWEHFYRTSGKPSQRMEYCVVEGIVTDICQKGKRPSELQLLARPPERGDCPVYYGLGDVGSKVFFTLREAAGLARKQTEKEEKTFWFCHEEPLRRPWAELERRIGEDDEN